MEKLREECTNLDSRLQASTEQVETLKSQLAEALQPNPELKKLREEQANLTAAASTSPKPLPRIPVAEKESDFDRGVSTTTSKAGSTPLQNEQTTANSKLSAEDLKVKGNQCFIENRFHKAITYYSESLEKKLDHVVLSNRCQSYLSLKYYEAALADANESIRLNPNFVKSYWHRALALINLGIHSKARADLKHILEVESENKAAQDLLLKILITYDKPIVRGTFAPISGLGTSRINKPTIVPKAAIIKEKDSNLKDKLRHKAETPEESRKKQLHETQEKIRNEKEEKEKKNRERQQRLEEETRSKHEATKLKEAKMREFEAIQREEVRPVPSTTNTPKKDNKKNKEVLTPRQALVPAKKGKTLPAQKFDFEVISPVRKHKRPTPPNAAPSKAATPKPKESVDLFANDDEEEENNQLADEEDNAQPLNYIEITPEKAEADIRSKRQGHALSSDDIPNVSRTSYGNETPKIARSSDIVSDSFHSKANKFKLPGKIFHGVIQDSVVNESFANNVSHTEHVVNTEPMEEDEYENDENAVPMQRDINKSSYDMTVDKVYLPSRETNYNVDDLSSNDETDDESKPRKTVPNWAKKHELNPHVKKMLRDH